MVLTHLSTIRYENGLYEVDVKIDQRPYTYYLNSAYVLNKFMGYYSRKVTHGRAINILNKWKVTI